MFHFDEGVNSIITLQTFHTQETTFHKMVHIILGSSSKWRRREIESLFRNAMDLRISMMSPEIDEKAIRHEDAEQLVLAIAHAKADALLPRIPQSTERIFLITADQVARYKGQIREKPKDRNQAFEFLKSYSNSSVETISGIVVTDVSTNIRQEGVDIATVYFSHIGDDLIQRTIDREDVMNCCGGFMIDDEELKDCVVRIDGGSGSIMGISKRLTVELLLKHDPSLIDISKK